MHTHTHTQSYAGGSGARVGGVRSVRDRVFRSRAAARAKSVPNFHRQGQCCGKLAVTVPCASPHDLTPILQARVAVNTGSGFGADRRSGAEGRATFGSHLQSPVAARTNTGTMLNSKPGTGAGAWATGTARSANLGTESPPSPVHVAER